MIKTRPPQETLLVELARAEEALFRWEAKQVRARREVKRWRSRVIWLRLCSK